MTNLNTVTAYSLNAPKKNFHTNSLKPANFRNEVNYKQAASSINSQKYPSFTAAAQLTLVQDVVPYNLLRKINRIFDSIVDARNVLLKHKPTLATTINVEEDCITALDTSTKVPNLFYKREDLTSIGAYKVRGALYQASKIVEENPDGDLSFFAASTGNHALGVLKAAEALKLHNVTICVPENVAIFKRQKLEKRVSELNKRGLNARLVVEGETFDHTNQIAQQLAAQDKHSFYIDPYNNHNAVAGQGTIGLELLSQLSRKLSKEVERLTVIVPIGGGGLISGISCALKEGISKFPNLKKLKLNVIGVKLADLNSKYGDAIKVRSTGNHNKDLIADLVERQFTIDDTDMKKGIDFILDDLGVKVEGASAGTLKPVLGSAVRPSKNHAVVCLLSGGNILV